jgi:molybdopterin synthase sulfur carrier subunit
MKVDFYSTLRDIVGQKTVEITVPDACTVRQLLEAIFTCYPVMRKHLVDEHGQMYPHVHLFVSGRDSKFLENGLETVIDESNHIGLFPAVGGG